MYNEFPSFDCFPMSLDIIVEMAFDGPSPVKSKGARNPFLLLGVEMMRTRSSLVVTGSESVFATSKSLSVMSNVFNISAFFSLMKLSDDRLPTDGGG